MKILKTLLIVLLVFLAAFFLGAVFLPKEMSVSRSIEIAKAPKEIYNVVADFHTWGTWSHWAKMDPSQKVVISGADKKTGSMMSWEGKKTGTGTQTLTTTDENKSLVYEMHFLKPSEGFAKTWFTFEPTQTGTKITWKLTGPSKYPVGRWMGLMMGSMLGTAFDNSLASLKVQVENKK